MLVSCQEKDDKKIIAEKIDAMIEVIEAEKRRALLEFFSDNVIVQKQLGKRDVGAMAFRYFYAHDNIRLFVRFININIDEDKLNAEVSAKVLLTSGEKRLPNRARLYAVEGNWQKLQGDWVIARLDWQRLPEEFKD